LFGLAAAAANEAAAAANEAAAAANEAAAAANKAAAATHHFHGADLHHGRNVTPNPSWPQGTQTLTFR